MVSPHAIDKAIDLMDINIIITWFSWDSKNSKNQHKFKKTAHPCIQHPPSTHSTSEDHRMLLLLLRTHTRHPQACWLLTSSLRWYFHSCSEPANSKRINIDQAKNQAGNLQLWTVVTTRNYKSRCSDVIPSPLEQSSGSLVLYSQSFPQTRASSIFWASQLLWSPRILPPKQKVDSDDTVLEELQGSSEL